MKEYSPGQLLRDYVERRGYGHAATAREANDILSHHEPELAAMLEKLVVLMYKSDDGHLDVIWCGLLEEPRTLCVEDEEIVLTEHGERLAYAYRKDV